ncbi:hypothetical protein AB6A40_009616 [Gnathostoma spinigerum]|uniref:Uncharacterized protein n=1 Tax=Gnathostoma spinigerum TaxID=75299 RepID=A0ABD6F0Z4_9BILA
MLISIRPQTSIARHNSNPPCRLFSLNNRPLYECTNASLNEIPQIPSGTMTLQMSHNPLRSLALLNNSEIVSLLMQNCQLQRIAPEAFSYAINLRELDLSNNYLGVLVFRPTWLRIERLNLAHNAFRIVPDLSNLKYLTYVDLSHNAITELPHGHLLLPQLEWIDLSNNALSNIIHSNIPQSTKILELDRNHWNCDCRLREFVRYQRRTLVARSLSCSQPPSLLGVKWDDLDIMVGSFL